MAQPEEDTPITDRLPTIRKHKLFLRAWPYQLPPEWDDCDAGAAFDDIDDLLEDWSEEDY